MIFDKSGCFWVSRFSTNRGVALRVCILSRTQFMRINYLIFDKSACSFSTNAGKVQTFRVQQEQTFTSNKKAHLLPVGLKVWMLVNLLWCISPRSLLLYLLF